MLKKDLKDGMILETKKGQRHLLTNGVMRDYYGYLVLESYSDDLKNIYDEDFNIVKVYKDTGRFSLKDTFEDRNLTIIWERKETKLTDYDKLLEYVKEMSEATYQEYAGGHKYKVNENYLDELSEIKEGVYRAQKQEKLLELYKELANYRARVIHKLLDEVACLTERNTTKEEDITYILAEAKSYGYEDKRIVEEIKKIKELNK